MSLLVSLQRLLQLLLVLNSSFLKFLIDDKFMVSNRDEIFFKFLGKSSFYGIAFLLHALCLLILG